MTAKSPIVTTSALARHLGLTDRRVQQLVEEGVLPRRRDGKLDQDACRLKYIKYLQTEGRRAKGSDARDRAQLARAEMLELQAARERGELGYFSDMEEVFTDVLGAFRAELSGVPTASNSPPPSPPCLCPPGSQCVGSSGSRWRSSTP